MRRTVEAEIHCYESYISQIAGYYSAEEIAPYLWRLAPRLGQWEIPASKDTALTLLGITHGNEVAGLVAVNEFLGLLASRLVPLEVPIVVGLGNPDAARQGIRFIDRDLNRCFASADSSSREGRRAKEIERALATTYRLLDFHQTTQRCEMPFFIFPYCRQGFEFARKIDNGCAVVTHWGDAFSSEGMCTDEFVNKSGGIGISVELGQNGFDPYQIAFGSGLALAAYRSVLSELNPDGHPRISTSQLRGPIFSWEAVVPWPAVGTAILDPGWHNFRRITKGEPMGAMDDGTPILAEAGGRVLFAKYLHADAPGAPRPTELYRVMKEIDEAEFPSDV